MGGVTLKYLDCWYEQPLGAAFAKIQQAEIKAVIPRLKGQRLLQLGVNPGIDLQEASGIPHCVTLACDITLKQSNPFVVGSYHALPFFSESIDVVLVNQVLEFKSDLQLVLEEVHRVLTGEGQVVIMGFNAFSLWGLAHLFKGKQKQLPWRGHFHTAFEVNRALLNLDFQILLNKTFFFRPAFRSAYLLNNLKFLEKIGPLLFKGFGAGYLLVAQKKTVALNPPLRSRWQLSELAVDRAIKPIARI